MGAYATMNEGRLVWSLNRENRNWYCESWDEQFLYVASKLEPGLWSCEVRKRCGDRTTEVIGVRSTLLLAKRVADEHHHLHIRRHGSLGVHEYILRYPLKDVAAQ